MTREQSIKRSNNAIFNTELKGKEAFYEGKDQSANPYPKIHRGQNMACGGRWWRHWNDGWIEAKRQHEQELLTRAPKSSMERSS